MTLVIFSLFGFIFFDAVYIVAIMNYAIQSELNIYLLHALRIKIERREHKTIDAAIKVSKHGNHIAAHMIPCALRTLTRLMAT